MFCFAIHLLNRLSFGRPEMTGYNAQVAFAYSSYPAFSRVESSLLGYPQSRTWLLLSGYGREVFQQLLHSLAEVFVVLLLVFARVNRLGGSTDPNQLFCGRVSMANY
jgi:hypothetical protein